jgi:hypothetical protein
MKESINNRRIKNEEVIRQSTQAFLWFLEIEILRLDPNTVQYRFKPIKHQDMGYVLCPPPDICSGIFQFS